MAGRILAAVPVRTRTLIVVGDRRVPGPAGSSGTRRRFSGCAASWSKTTAFERLPLLIPVPGTGG